MKIRTIGVLLLFGMTLVSTGCATYCRDRVRDFRDIYSFKAGRMTGLRVQAGPAEAAAIWERLPAPLYCGRELAREQRFRECADAWDVTIPVEGQAPEALTSAFSMRLGIPYRRHWWRIGGNRSRKIVRDITQREVDDYHRAKTMDDIFHIVYESKEPLPLFPVDSTNAMPRTGYDRTEIGVRLKSRPMSDVGLELGLYCGVSARVNLMEILDFALGFFFLDILHDDIPSITPEGLRRSSDLGIKRSRYY